VWRERMIKYKFKSQWWVVVVPGLLWGLASTASANDTAAETAMHAYTQKCHALFQARAEALCLRCQDVPEQRRIQFAMMEQAQCTCVADRVRATGDARLPAALLTNDGQASAFLQRAAQECMALGARVTMRPLCLADAQAAGPNETDEQKAARAAVCHCIGDAVEKLDDATMIAEADAAYENFQARIRDASIPKRKGVIDAIETRCQAKG